MTGAARDRRELRGRGRARGLALRFPHPAGRALRRFDPQHDGGAGRAGVRREAARLRGPDPDRERAALLRRSSRAARSRRLRTPRSRRQCRGAGPRRGDREHFEAALRTHPPTRVRGGAARDGTRGASRRTGAALGFAGARGPGFADGVGAAPRDRGRGERRSGGAGPARCRTERARRRSDAGAGSRRAGARSRGAAIARADAARAGDAGSAGARSRRRTSATPATW